MRNYIKIVSKALIVFTFFALSCSDKKETNYTVDTNLLISQCDSQIIDINLDSIVFRNLRNIKNTAVSHNLISLELVLNVMNSSNDEIMFEVDNKDYSFFNFKTQIKGLQGMDTIYFNSFQNPRTIPK